MNRPYPGSSIPRTPEEFIEKSELGKANPREPDPSMKTLLEVSIGSLSVIDAARELNLPDGGFVLRLMGEARLPFPKLPDDPARRQAGETLEALKKCLIERRGP